MSNRAGSTFSRGGSPSVLLVGDARGAFVDADGASPCACEVAVSLLDAVDIAARGDFRVVGVVMDGSAGQLHAALRALRRSARARIVLLARMHEEPIARRLVEENMEGERLADEYLVCPTRLARLYDLACAESRPAREAPSARQVETEAPQAGPPPDAAAAADAGALEQRIRQLEYLATTDDLTGLKNRRYILEFARQVLDRAGRGGGRVTLLLFDIDNFKRYNDTCGHLAGDEILRQVGILMRRCCRPHDVVARIGGDEFAVLFWDDPYRTDSQAGASPRRAPRSERRSADTDHPAQAISVAKRFQRELGHTDLHLLGPGAEGVLTISGGLASFPRDAGAVQGLFQRADLALLEAKRDGKNRIYLVGEPQSDIAEMP
jgi:GGDEF domain-containing protein